MSALDKTTENKKPFHKKAGEGIEDAFLQTALDTIRTGFVNSRKNIIADMEDFPALRSQSTEIKNRALDALYENIIRFEKELIARGGKLHFAKTAEDMRKKVVEICKQEKVKTISKGKSIIGEEVGLNEALESAGITPYETDLGEYILQLAKETPSHIVVPAMHKTRKEVIDLFEKQHKKGKRKLKTVESIVEEVRDIIRERFLQADAGITGANFLIADTASAVLVTNEGNADLSVCLPKTYIITASIEKIIGSWQEASALLRVLGRSATGQAMTAYSSFYTPEKGQSFHVILLDNGRTEILDSKYRDMLKCIRCGACLNHCPVYQTIGGHAYQSIYAGPMGAVLTPLLRGEKEDYALPNASSFCGRCEEVCPVSIPLPELMRQLRNDEGRGQQWKPSRWLVKGFMCLARVPFLYRNLTHFIIWLATKLLARKDGTMRGVFFIQGWTKYRDLTNPEGGSFQKQWRKRKR